MKKKPAHGRKVICEDLYVTRPQLPPLEDVIPSLEKIWNSHTLTNNGAFHQQLEGALCEYLGVDHISLFANGTLALVTAMQALRLSGEVITTPYSFVATANALLWNQLTPVFVDIDPVTLNLDPAQVEAAITPQTRAILPVHVYGIPADVAALQEIAGLYGLRVIYDAAHCFGVDDDEGSILRHGDMSILSFHATKVFNTFEGGAIISPDAKTKARVDYLKNFGFANETTVVAAGINAKMNEFQAAVGIAQLKYIDEAIDRRSALDRLYRRKLADIGGIRCHVRAPCKRYNYAYFPIFIDDEYALDRDALYFRLREAGVFGRRYFYPLIPEFPMYKNSSGGGRHKWPNATSASRRVICLPMYPAMDEGDVERVVEVVRLGQIR